MNKCETLKILKNFKKKFLKNFSKKYATFVIFYLK